MTLERFLDDATLQWAFVCSIEVIGEAADGSECRVGLVPTASWPARFARAPPPDLWSHKRSAFIEFLRIADHVWSVEQIACLLEAR